MEILGEETTWTFLGDGLKMAGHSADTGEETSWTLLRSPQDSLLSQ